MAVIVVDSSLFARLNWTTVPRDDVIKGLTPAHHIFPPFKLATVIDLPLTEAPIVASAHRLYSVILCHVDHRHLCRPAALSRPAR